jgi:hypothetical protein
MAWETSIASFLVSTMLSMLSCGNGDTFGRCHLAVWCNIEMSSNGRHPHISNNNHCYELRTLWKYEKQPYINVWLSMLHHTHVSVPAVFISVTTGCMTDPSSHGSIIMLVHHSGPYYLKQLSPSWSWLHNYVIRHGTVWAVWSFLWLINKQLIGLCCFWLLAYSVRWRRKRDMRWQVTRPMIQYLQ